MAKVVYALVECDYEWQRPIAVFTDETNARARLGQMQATPRGSKVSSTGAPYVYYLAPVVIDGEPDAYGVGLMLGDVSSTA